VGSAGFMELRIADPGPAAAPWANPLVFEILPPPEPDRPADEVHNRVGLDDRGILTWNGAPIDLVTLRQYCDVTQTMDPLPSLRLDIDGQASYRDTGPILGILWRARVQRIDMSDPGRRGDGDSGLRLSATSLVR
jgi:hypothetical protein